MKLDNSWMDYSGVDLNSFPGQVWVLVHVNRNREHTLANLCIRKDISFFLPAIIKKGTKQKYKRPSWEILWPGYMLCRLDIENANLIKQLSFVKNLTQVAHEKSLLSHCRELKQDIEDGKLNPNQLDVGDIVEVKSGPLMGLRGSYLSIKEENRIVLNVESINKSLVVEVPLEAVEAIEKKSLLREDDNSEFISTTVAIINSELVRYLARHPDAMYELSPRKFEELVAELLRDMGYDVWLTQRSKDGGRDVLAVFRLPDGEILTVVECKRFAPDARVGPDIVHKLLWVADRHDNASRAILATTSRFTTGAKVIEKKFGWRLSLRDFDGITEWLSGYGTWRKEGNGGLWLPSMPIVLEKGKRRERISKKNKSQQ